ncbi:MAG TPA: polysaccharide biosynthesis/export family protein, partial [Terriglobia bacterium]|nr:polysaccharide biosynthesis/export family protein [Terriglobia bacterium]
MRRRTEGQSRSLSLALAVALSSASLVRAQLSRSSIPAVNSVSSQDYTLGSGDVIDVNLTDLPELSGSYRISGAGYVTLPGLPAPVGAEGLTTQQESQAIAAALKRDQLLRDPRVSVFVLEYHSHTVTVLGAVLKPSVYSLQRPTTLLEILSRAGGLTPVAGNTVQIIHKDPEGSPAATRTEKIDMAKLMSGADPSLNREVRAGDVITVSTAPVVYVIGAVVKPGGYALQDASVPITVLKALAMAEGLDSVASKSRALVLRRGQTNQNQEIPVNIGKLMTGRAPDMPLEGNDVLFVPESRAKKGLADLRVAALEAMEGVALYGV